MAALVWLLFRRVGELGGKLGDEWQRQIGRVMGRGTIGGKKRMKGGGLGLGVCRNWWQRKTNKVATKDTWWQTWCGTWWQTFWVEGTSTGLQDLT